MRNEFSRIVTRSILLAGIVAVAASCGAFAQNKTIGFKPGGNLSEGRVVGNMLFVAGLKGTPATGTLADLDISAQTALALDAIKKVVDEAGFKMTDIVSVNVYLVDINEIDKMNVVYRKMMPDPKPTRVTVEVGHIRSGGRNRNLVHRRQAIKKCIGSDWARPRMRIGVTCADSQERRAPSFAAYKPCHQR